ncbi:AAA family ATPase [Iamia majanohamensis]|uniref:AAA family ATPase n=1 Tax=Iamia majanohamensis TaxID=467976 RepID=A0AAF0BUL0_9ACTN|nr:UvrD-helicase domain-containing protein [Iamia majanohamensis]WCO67927.1 AAA family ATPase [Iamia majanohamensis]
MGLRRTWGTTLHPELEAEQAYIDFAYECLAAARDRASSLRTMVEVGRGGTEQARFEREVIFDSIAQRLGQLELGDATLCFGRIDTEPEAAAPAPGGVVNGHGPPVTNGHGPAAATDAARADGALPAGPPPAPPGPAGGAGDTFYIGRVAVSDANQEVVVVDWRAPVAEPFYRATGRSPMGLARRRHFATRGRRLLGIEDELFGERALGLGRDDGISGHGALIAALETARSGRLGDIVATIQGEQDEIIRAPMPGVLVVQGGPGTGKTVVALHRAAYLLYTHRFPLEDQGVLVIGPNRLFLGYIEQVLPSLGEAGVQLAVLADLVDTVAVRGRDDPLPARVKGDARMVKVLAKAVRDRKRPLRRDLVVGYGLTHLRLTVAQSERIVADARRRARHHNGGRRFVEQGVWEALADSARTPVDPGEVRSRLRHTPEVREALERMWPVLTPAQLLHDLYGSHALLELAGRRHLSDEEVASLVRPRSESVEAVTWTVDDVPVLDEARALLGATPRGRRNGDTDDLRTYGHIIVDEAQDLSPMQLRMLTRRSLNGSMTVVGDIAQSTGAWAHASWDEVLDLLPERRPPRRAELTVGYRIPGPNMALAARVLAEAAPEISPPQSVREDGRDPHVVQVAEADLAAQVAATTITELAEAGTGNLGVICPGSLTDRVSEALTRAGVDHGVALTQGLSQQVTVVPVNMVKGLELDATVVVEPALVVEEEPQGMRSLYVALTRATKLLSVVHALPLPAAMAPEGATA